MSQLGNGGGGGGGGDTEDAGGREGRESRGRTDVRGKCKVKTALSFISALLFSFIRQYRHIRPPPLQLDLGSNDSTLAAYNNDHTGI